MGKEKLKSVSADAAADTAADVAADNRGVNIFRNQELKLSEQLRFSNAVSLA